MPRRLLKSGREITHRVYPYLLPTFLCLLIALALNGLDYKNFGDVFRQGKIRWLFVAFVPVLFLSLKKHLTFAPAFFVSLAAASWTLHDFPVGVNFNILQILAVAGVSVVCVRLGKTAFGILLALSGLFQASVALLQVCGVHYWFTPMREQDMHLPVGLMGHETVLGIFLVAAMCPALWGGAYLSAFIMAVAVVATCSSMSMAALGAVVVLFVWSRVNFRSAAAVAAAGLGAIAGLWLISPNHPFLSLHGRMSIWPYGWDAFMEHPFFGSGVGSWATHYMSKHASELVKAFGDTIPLQMHCDPLDFLIDYGVVPALVLGACIVRFAVRFKPTWPSAVCVAILVNSLGNFPLCLVNIAVIFVVCWAFSNRVYLRNAADYL